MPQRYGKPPCLCGIGLERLYSWAMYKKEWVGRQKTDGALKEMESKEEPSTGAETLYIAL